MRFCGKVYKDGKFWLAEIPILDAMTQGHPRKEAYGMVKDLLETPGNRLGHHHSTGAKSPLYRSRSLSGSFSIK